MKKIIFTSLLLLAMAFTFSCSAESAKPALEETKKPLDWKDTIEYEGSFFVNETTRILYALDKGSITLWDSAGDGRILQTIEYDTAVSDAIERIEKEDFNNDENCDIRIINTESEDSVTYRLWLWNTISSTFTECTKYASLISPVYNEETGHIVSVEDKGIFGTVTRVVAFNEQLGLDDISITLNDPDGVARGIADALGGGTVELNEDTVRINEQQCKIYNVSSDTRILNYLACSDDGMWYIDEDCRGFYRALREEDGKPCAGYYTGDAGTAADIAKAKGKGEPEIMRMKEGSVDGKEAVRYTVHLDELNVFVAVDSARHWYVSTDGIEYTKCDRSNGAPLSSEIYEFVIPEPEFELVEMEE